MVAPTRIPLKSSAPEAAGALSGVRVADFSHFLAGPFCTMVLGDLGAEIIKIEKIEGGDDFRRFHPQMTETQGAPFLWGNRNKKSMAIDLKRLEGLEIAREIAIRSDVLIENFSTGTMQRLGLGYETLSQINPRLIYCSISAYGRTGPLKDRLGFDPIVQAESGFISMNGEPEGVGAKSTASIMDISTGMMAANAVLAALFARQSLGKGQLVECVLFDQAITMLGFHAMNYLVTGLTPERSGNNSLQTVPTGTFLASDGPIYVTCANDRTFQRLVTEVLRRADLATNPNFATSMERVKNREELLGELSAIIATNTRSVWLAKMRHSGVPAGPINTLAEALGSPELRDRGLITEIMHPALGSVPNIALPIKLADTPLVSASAAPLLGQHSEQVLHEVLGYDQQRIDDLIRSGAVART